MAAAEVYSPTAAAAAQQQQRGKVASQAWRTVVGWIGFLLQVLLQILRGTPSRAQLMGFVGFRYPSSPGPRPPSPVAALVVQALAGPPCPVAVLSGEALPPPPDPACFPGLLVLPPPPPSAGGVLASPTPTSLDSIIHARKQTHPPSYSLVHQRQTRAYRPDIFKVCEVKFNSIPVVDATVRM